MMMARARRSLFLQEHFDFGEDEIAEGAGGNNNFSVQHRMMWRKSVRMDDLIVFFALESLGTLAIVGNVCLVVVLLRNRYLQRASFVLMLSLALADVLHGLVTTSFFYPPILLRRTFVPPLGVRIFNILDWTAWSITLTHMSAICLDRLLAITLYGQYSQVITVRRARLFTLVCWCSFLVLNTLYILASFCCLITPLSESHFYTFGYGEFESPDELAQNAPLQGANLFKLTYTPLELLTLAVLSISNPITLIQLYRRHKRKMALKIQHTSASSKAVGSEAMIRRASTMLLEMSMRMGSKHVSDVGEMREMAHRRASRQQQRILFQISVVAIIFYLYMSAYYLLYHVLNVSNKWVVLFNSFFYSTTHMINPVIYFSLNKDMRAQLIRAIADCLNWVCCVDEAGARLGAGASSFYGRSKRAPGAAGDSSSGSVLRKSSFAGGGGGNCVTEATSSALNVNNGWTLRAKRPPPFPSSSASSPSRGDRLGALRREHRFGAVIRQHSADDQLMMTGRPKTFIMEPQTPETPTKLTGNRVRFEPGGDGSSYRLSPSAAAVGNGKSQSHWLLSPEARREAPSEKSKLLATASRAPGDDANNNESRAEMVELARTLASAAVSEVTRERMKSPVAATTSMPPRDYSLPPRDYSLRPFPRSNHSLGAHAAAYRSSPLSAGSIPHNLQQSAACSSVSSFLVRDSLPGSPLYELSGSVRLDEHAPAEHLELEEAEEGLVESWAVHTGEEEDGECRHKDTLERLQLQQQMTMSSGERHLGSFLAERLAEGVQRSDRAWARVRRQRNSLLDALIRALLGDEDGEQDRQRLQPPEPEAVSRRRCKRGRMNGLLTGEGARGRDDAESDTPRRKKSRSMDLGRSSSRGAGETVPEAAGAGQSNGWIGTCENSGTPNNWRTMITMDRGCSPIARGVSKRREEQHEMMSYSRLKESESEGVELGGQGREDAEGEEGDDEGEEVIFL